VTFRGKLLLLSLLAGLIPALAASAQSREYKSLADLAVEKFISQEALRLDVDYLSGPFCQGRGASQAGLGEAGLWEMRQFASQKLIPMDGTMCQSFIAGGHVCHNIVGMISARIPSYLSNGRYLIIMAHYDNLGVLEGKTYPGADSNASGVAVMNRLIRAFRYLSERGMGLPQNIIFAALDGKQLSLAGAQDLCSRIALGRLHDPVTGKAIRARDISAVINLDILGGVSAPLTKGRKDYLMMLGGGRHNTLLQNLNRRDGLRLEIGLDYYGSKGFTELFLNRVSDQRPFRERGIYAVMFTSGITMDTNRESDTEDKIDYDVLRKRTELIFRWTEQIIHF
jgi:hypothetical protein